MKLFTILMTTLLLSGCSPRKEKSVSITLSQTEITNATEAVIQKEEPPLDSNRTYISKGFSYGKIDENIKSRIEGVSYPASGAEIGLEELSYVEILHYDFEGNINKGELIVNAELAKEVTEIFYELYENKYPVESVKLIDEFNGDDEASMTANNSSAFNYRTIAGTNKLSKHGRGAAIDINPLYNPCVTESGVAPAAGKRYADRKEEFAGKIDEDDLAYKLFTKAGWTWGGHWKSLKDYQHFEKDV